MARGQRSIVHATKSPLTDDLTRIKGIGPLIARRLQDAGIHTFAKLGELTPEQVASLLPNLSAGRVRREGWISQARKLVTGKIKPGTRRKETGIATGRQHYETFTFEFLLDEQNKTRRLRVIHIQSGDVDTWSRWDAERLVDFLSRHTGEHLSYAPTASFRHARPEGKSRQLTLATPSASSLSEANSVGPVEGFEERTDSLFYPASPISETAESLEHPDSETVVHSSALSGVTTGSRGKIRLLEWQTVPNNADQPSRIVSQRPFQVRLMLAATGVSVPDKTQLIVTTSLYARKLGNRDRRMISETQSSLCYASVMNLTIANVTLPQGLYHMEALMRVRLIGGKSSGQPDLLAFFEGGPLQIY